MPHAPPPSAAESEVMQPVQHPPQLAQTRTSSMQPNFLVPMDMFVFACSQI